MRFFRACIFVLISVFAVSCAIQVPPDGGQKDVDPPVIVLSEPKNYSSGFSGNDIRIDFDENIALNDLSTQLIVSPLLKYNPEIKVRKKSLFIHFNDTLLPNTTYTMNFGEGIMDNNEGNKLENFQYVFSTGQVIDSLDINGAVIKTFDQKTEKGILVSLYRNTADSVPYLERPLYFSRTNDSGAFRINNIAPGFYKIISLKETDGDYIYSGVNEMIGFADSLIKAGAENIVLENFEETPKLRLQKYFSVSPGRAVLVFNSAADTVKINWLGDSTGINYFARSLSPNHDSLTIWYRNVYADSLKLVLDNGTLNDTVIIRLFKRSEESFGRRRDLVNINNGNSQTEIQHLHLPRYIQINHPVITADFDRIVLLEDSLPVKSNFYFTDTLQMNLSIDHKWKSGGKYSLFIPPGTFSDVFNYRNDTFELSFPAHDEKDYGSVNINFNPGADNSYILQLTDEAGTFVYRESFANKDTAIEFSNINPGRYKIKLIKDANQNKKWDTGNYLGHKQPEEILFYPESILVRANWDVDVSVRLPFSAFFKK